MERLNILLVGDTPQLAKAREAVIDDPAVEAVSARTLSEALDRVAEQEFGAILLDLDFPDADAMDAAHSIRRAPHGAHVPLMLLGSRIDGPSLAATLRPVDFLVPPVAPGALRSRLHFLADLQDITGHREAEQQRQEADRQKDEFLAMLAHELRNPLAAIGNAASVARTPGLESRRDWSLTVIARQVGQLAKLIDNLTEASRVTLGKIELHVEHVDLAQVLRRAVDAAQSDMAPRRQRVEITRDGDPLMVVGDPARLEQVLLNLLSNASRYSPAETRVHVAASQAGGWVTVRVRDEGVGLEPRMLTRVFDLFVQAPSKLDRAQGGLGIGLSLARRLAELHGGTITAQSEGPGRGTEFVVRLPAADTSTADDTSPPETSRGATRETTALVVDDNVDAAEALAILLEGAGLRVVTAHDGETALARVAEVKPDFVLMDLGLPVLDGYEVAARLRAQPEWRDLVLVAVSGYGSEQDQRRSAAAGFDHHLVKPVDYPALLRLLREPARRHRRAGSA